MIISGPRRVDQLIRLPTRLAVLRPISLCASLAPAPFKATTGALRGDGFGREPLADRLLRTATPTPNCRVRLCPVVDLVLWGAYS